MTDKMKLKIFTWIIYGSAIILIPLNIFFGGAEVRSGHTFLGICNFLSAAFLTWATIRLIIHSPIDD